MRKSTLCLGVAVAALPMMLAPIARAQDATTPAPSAQQADAQRTNDLAALAEAQNKLLEAQNARFKAQMDALGLPKTDGKTTLGTDAGKIESWMLAGGTLTAAAKAIDSSVGTGPIALLDSDDVLDLNKGSILQREMNALRLALQSVAPSGCGRRAGAAIAIPPLAALGAVLSLLRTDTEIIGMTVDGAEGALLNAVAGTAAGKYVIPAEIARTSETGTTVVTLKALAEARANVPACRVEIESAARTDAQKKAATDQIAKLDAVAARIDTYLTAIATRSEGKPSDLEIAMLGDTVIEAHPDLRVLRVKLEKAGGTLLKRANLFTMLGAPAVGITGGAVISWHLVNPATGMVDAGGVLVCRTELTNLNDIHQGEVRASKCGPEVKDSLHTERNAQ
jgi:hypothetical protein